MTRKQSLHTACAMLVTFLVLGCQRSDPSPVASTSSAVPVTVATAAQSDAPVLIRTIGSAQAKASVVLKPQVSGRVAEILATEGSEVEVGQPLINLDEAWYKAAVQQREADLAQSRAMSVDAHNLEERNRAAVASSALSQRELEQAQARSAAADAETASKQADLETARLNLAYCKLVAPFSGRLGQFLVKPGAIVKENETELVEINQVDPIEVAFSIPEQRMPAIREAMSKESAVLRVEVIPSGDTNGPIVGELSFVDSRVDANTGTIKLKAVFPNADHRLWPGRFVNVTLVLGVERSSVQIPDSAIQATQDGPAVFVVNAQQTVELRPVSIRRSFDGKSIIDKGINAGDVVVVEGQLRLGPGAAVQIKNSSTPKG